MTVIWLFGGPLVGMIEQWSSYMIDRRTEKGMLTGLWGQGDRASPAANVTLHRQQNLASSHQHSLQQPYVTLWHISENPEAALYCKHNHG